jgi:hypothetical protein
MKCVHLPVQDEGIMAGDPTPAMGFGHMFDFSEIDAGDGDAGCPWGKRQALQKTVVQAEKMIIAAWDKPFKIALEQSSGISAIPMR